MEAFEKGVTEEKTPLQKLKNTIRAFSVFATVIAGSAESSSAYAEGVKAPGMDIITSLYGQEHTDEILSGEIKITREDIAVIRDHWESVKPDADEAEDLGLSSNTFDKTNERTEHVLNGLEQVAKLQSELRIAELELCASALLLEMEALKLEGETDPDSKEGGSMTAEEIQKKINEVMEEIVRLTPEEGSGE